MTFDGICDPFRGLLIYNLSLSKIILHVENSPELLLYLLLMIYIIPSLFVPLLKSRLQVCVLVWLAIWACVKWPLLSHLYQQHEQHHALQNSVLFIVCKHARKLKHVE